MSTSGSGKLLKALVAALVAVLGQGVKQRGGSGGTQQGATHKSGSNPAQSAARWRAPAGGRSSTAAVDEKFEESPGQFGNGATRDLTRDEIRHLKPSYSPAIDGAPDPGEVVWTWVPYVENDGRGKDRPVLIIARLDGAAWAACYLSTKDHRDFVSVGTGPWDSKGRESFLSPERVLRVTESGMRRESAGLDRSTFENAVAMVLRYHGVL